MTSEFGARSTERALGLIDETIAALSPRPATVTPAAK
jgi:hypothetical protein